MKGSVDNIKKSKNTIFELLITTVSISAGINLVVLGISNILGVNYNISFIVAGTLLILISMFVIFFRQLKLSNRHHSIEAILVYDRINHELVDIENYPISYDIRKYLEAAISEDKNIEAMWKKDKLGYKSGFKEYSPNYPFDVIYEYDDSSLEISQSGTLINSVLEYIILTKLSTWTKDYFNKSCFKKKKIKKIQRDEINDFVASNAFVNLFSRSPSERIAFDNTDIDENVILAHGKNGALYDRFELYVPNKCKFIKEKPNSIIFRHPYFKLKITPEFTAFDKVLPYDFENRYMRIENFSAVNNYQIMIDVELKFSISAFFMNKSQYYGWIDEFIQELTNYASIEYFFEKINWDTVHSILMCK